MRAKGAGRSGISQIEVEVENVLASHGLLFVQFLEDDVHQQVAFLQLVVDDSQDRKHIFLSAQLHPVVHLSVEVNGQVAYLQQWALHVQQEGSGVHHVLALHDDSSSEGERTVEPCRHDGTSVHLSVELHDTSLAVYLCMRLDAECG